MKSKEEEDLLSIMRRSWKLGLGFIRLDEEDEMILALSSANASQNALCVMKLSFLLIKISQKKKL